MTTTVLNNSVIQCNQNHWNEFYSVLCIKVRRLQSSFHFYIHCLSCTLLCFMHLQTRARTLSPFKTFPYSGARLCVRPVHAVYSTYCTAPTTPFADLISHAYQRQSNHNHSLDVQRAVAFFVLALGVLQCILCEKQ